jgi:ABC-type transport system involved in multi-copper enzyme maturation permease subunit
VTRDVRLRQLKAVFLLELKRLLRGREGRAAMFFAAAPFLLALAALTVRDGPAGVGQVEKGFAFIFQNLVLQGTLFFGTLFVFGGLLRGEQIAKTLHHLLLAPVRREVVLLGKYLAALALTSGAFGVFSALAYVTLLSGTGKGAALAHLSSGGGAGRLVSYVLVAALACAAYGAVFLAFGQWVKNPIFPALLFWGWEHLNFLLPEGLKRLGLIHYLLSLTPVRVPESFLAILGDPLPAWVAVPVPLLLTATLLALSAWKVRRMEVDYGME